MVPTIAKPGTGAQKTGGARKGDLRRRFEAAARDVQKLAKRPADRDLLEFYALYKQATAGDVTGPRPGLLDVRGRAKYDAWAKRKGTTADEAMVAYVALVARLGSA
ncbi:MAG: acyl-CoA-binding protein [Steroidobacteraceae bacterium]|jgi:acyl-CoA-binding protein|nr:acyl-CoA-binding protein [Steroidobacteraceae bacterium]